MQESRETGYKRYYTITAQKKTPTNILAWKDGVLVQKWKILENHSIYCDKDKLEYSHSENFQKEEWIPIPNLITLTPSTHN